MVDYYTPEEDSTEAAVLPLDEHELVGLDSDNPDYMSNIDPFENIVDPHSSSNAQMQSMQAQLTANEARNAEITTTPVPLVDGNELKPNVVFC